MRRLHDLAFVVVVLIAAALCAWLSVHIQFRSDWSYGQRASLSSRTQDVLKKLNGPVSIVSYARTTGELRGTIAAFIARYQQLKPDIALRFVDPDTDPDAMRKQAITLDGEMVIHYAERTQRVTQLNERELTLALLKLTRDKPRVVGFLTGHGERKPLGEANADLGRFVQGLSDEGIRSIELNLNEQATIPSNIDLLVIASPQILFSENEVTRITQWIDEGGAVLGLTDPNSVSWLEPLKNTLGVFQLAGTLVDATGQGLGVGDPSFVAITRYPEHELLKGFSLTTLFPQSVAWAKIENNAFHAQSLLRSGERSWTETGNIKNDIAFSAAEAEIPGPHDLALALTRLSPRPDRAEQRIVLLGDGDFLSNTYLGNAGNRALGVRIINWLVADDALIDLTPAQAPDRILKLTRTKLAVIGFGFLFALPLLMVVIGFWIVWRRKRR